MRSIIWCHQSFCLSGGCCYEHLQLLTATHNAQTFNESRVIFLRRSSTTQKANSTCAVHQGAQKNVIVHNAWLGVSGILGSICDSWSSLHCSAVLEFSAPTQVPKTPPGSCCFQATCHSYWVLRHKCPRAAAIVVFQEPGRNRSPIGRTGLGSYWWVIWGLMGVFVLGSC